MPTPSKGTATSGSQYLGKDLQLGQQLLGCLLTPLEPSKPIRCAPRQTPSACSGSDPDWWRSSNLAAIFVQWTTWWLLMSQRTSLLTQNGLIQPGPWMSFLIIFSWIWSSIGPKKSGWRSLGNLTLMSLAVNYTVFQSHDIGSSPHLPLWLPSPSSPDDGLCPPERVSIAIITKCSVPLASIIFSKTSAPIYVTHISAQTAFLLFVLTATHNKGRERYWAKWFWWNQYLCCT